VGSEKWGKPGKIRGKLGEEGLEKKTKTNCGTFCGLASYLASRLAFSMCFLFYFFYIARPATFCIFHLLRRSEENCTRNWSFRVENWKSCAAPVEAIKMLSPPRPGARPKCVRT